LNLAFEYQGYHHFQSQNAFGDLGLIQNRDEEKRRACKSQGITLVEVPYWWQSGDVESLRAMLYQQRPDIFQ